MGQPFEYVSQFTSSDGTEWNRFGHSLAIESNFAVVGAPEHPSQRGAAYVFDMTTGEQLHKLSAPLQEDYRYFGTSAAIDGGKTIIGAPLDFHGSLGAAYIFDLATGAQLQRLTPSTTQPFHYFGTSVDISGGNAVIGAFGNDAPPAEDAAYLFDVVTGTERFKLIDPAARSFGFGRAVAIEGNRAIVTSREYIGTGNQVSLFGCAYLYDVTTGERLSRITPEDSRANDGFGAAAEIEGNLAVISSALGAYVFDLTSGEQLFKLAPPEPLPDAGFGRSLDVHGNLAIVGAPNTSGANLYAGIAFVYDITTGELLDELTVPSTVGNDKFAFSVALADDLILAGAVYEETEDIPIGAIHTFRTPTNLPGDFNRDGQVDEADYDQWRQQFAAVVDPFTAADGNGDGTVDAADFTVWRDNLIAEANTTLQPVPEPSRLLLTALPAIAVRRQRRPRST